MNQPGINLRHPAFWPIYPFPLGGTKSTWASAMTAYAKDVGLDEYLDRVWAQREIEAQNRGARLLRAFKAEASLGIFEHSRSMGSAHSAERGPREGKGLRAFVRGMARVFASRNQDLPSGENA